MIHTDQHYSPAEAAALLGVSSKTLRLYEERGLIRPIRDASGWRHYGRAQIEEARHIIALRALGLSLKQIGAVLSGSPAALQAALAGQEIELQARLKGLSQSIEQVRIWQSDLRNGLMPDLAKRGEPVLTLTLSWPWAGETFVLTRLAPVTYLVGSLGSGKTRLAKALAEALEGRFIDLDRQEPQTLNPDARHVLDWLSGDGATDTPALRALLGAMLGQTAKAVVVDLIEHNLDEPTQLALGAWLRRRGQGDVPLIVMTRSTAVLDLDAVADGHAIVYCPANHSPPFEVAPFSGTSGYESVANCLGTVEARERVAALRPA